MRLHPLPNLSSSAALAAVLLVSSPFDAVDAADFSGERIEIIIPASEGGGTDVWMRFWQPFMQRYLPGNPTVLIRNMPGGGHSIAGNWFMDNMESDGTNAIATTGSTQFPYLLGDPRVRYDYKEWSAVMASPVGGVTFVSPDLDVNSADEIKKLQGQELQYGSQGPTTLDLLPIFSYELLGIDIKPIFGMRGRGDARLAFERGELKLDYQTTPAYLQNVEPLVDSGSAIPLFSWGMLDDEGNMTRDPTFPDLPHFGEVYEMVQGKPLSGIEGDVFMAFFTAGYAAQKLLNFSSETPQDVLDAWATALEKATKDPEYQEKKEAQLGAYEQQFGEAAERMKARATTLTPEAKQYVLDWLKERFDVTLDN